MSSRSVRMKALVLAVVIAASALAPETGRRPARAGHSTRGCMALPWQWDPHLDWNAGPAC